MNIATTILGVAAFVFFVLYLRSQNELRDVNRYAEKLREMRDRLDALVEELQEKNRRLKRPPPVAEVHAVMDDLTPVLLYHLVEKSKRGETHRGLGYTTNQFDAMAAVRKGCRVRMRDGYRDTEGNLYLDNKLARLGVL